MSQVYLDLVDGFHIKVTPLRWCWLQDTLLYPRKQVMFRVEESTHGFHKGEELQRDERYLFSIAGHSKVSGKIKAVAPDLSHLEKI